MPLHKESKPNWARIILFDINTVCTQLNVFMYRKWFQSSIWPIDENLTGTITTGQSGPRSNGNEGELYITQSSRYRASPSDCLISFPGYSLRNLTHLKRCSRYILQPQPTELVGTVWNHYIIYWNQYSYRCFNIFELSVNVYIYICVCVCICVCTRIQTDNF